MRFWFFLLLSILCPFLLFAQGGTITGKVSRADTKSALGRATVFLSNSSFGTISNDDGSFSLTNIKPGQYQLVVTMVGFEDFSQTVLVGKDPIKINAQLLPKVIQLHDVIITTPANWKINYALFLKRFFGESADAKKCKILNPHDISLIYHKNTKVLEAYSYDFIQIENKALGYKIKFMLKSFKSDDINNEIEWEANVLYTEMAGNDAQKKEWQTRRDDIFYGSSRHFFRSLQNATLSQDGFQMMILERKRNPKRPPSDVIQHKIDMFTGVNLDSLNHWIDLYNLPIYDQKLNRQLLKETDVARAFNEPGLFGITFPDCLYVVYTRKREMTDFKDIIRPLDMPNYEVSVITLYKSYSLFDLNGSIVLPGSTLFEGSWSKNKVAELLPIDYVPVGPPPAPIIDK
jgi:hypothetical protein